MTAVCQGSLDCIQYLCSKCVCMRGLYVLLQQIACAQFLCYGEWHAVWVDLQPGLILLLRLWWAWWERGVKLLKELTTHFPVLPLGPLLWVQTSLSTVVCSIRIQPRLSATTINCQFDTVEMWMWKSASSVLYIYRCKQLIHVVFTPDTWQACCYILRYSLSYRTYWSQMVIHVSANVVFAPCVSSIYLLTVV